MIRSSASLTDLIDDCKLAPNALPPTSSSTLPQVLTRIRFSGLTPSPSPFFPSSFEFKMAAVAVFFNASATRSLSDDPSDAPWTRPSACRARASHVGSDPNINANDPSVKSKDATMEAADDRCEAVNTRVSSPIRSTLKFLSAMALWTPPGIPPGDTAPTCAAAMPSKETVAPTYPPDPVCGSNGFSSSHRSMNARVHLGAASTLHTSTQMTPTSDPSARSSSKNTHGGSSSPSRAADCPPHTPTLSACATLSQPSSSTSSPPAGSLTSSTP